MVRCGLVWGSVQFGVWFGVVVCGLVCGLVCGSVWFGVVRCGGIKNLCEGVRCDSVRV